MAHRMKIILRNHGNGRQDAAYVLVMTAGNPTILVGHYGKWSTYQTKGIAGLKAQQKAVGYGPATSACDALLREKLGKGYEPVALVDVPHHMQYLIAGYGSFPKCEVVDTSKISDPSQKSPEAFSKLPDVTAEEFKVGVDMPAPAEPSTPAPQTRSKTRAAALEL